MFGYSLIKTKKLKELEIDSKELLVTRNTAEEVISSCLINEDRLKRLITGYKYLAGFNCAALLPVLNAQDTNRITKIMDSIIDQYSLDTLNEILSFYGETTAKLKADNVSMVEDPVVEPEETIDMSELNLNDNADTKTTNELLTNPEGVAAIDEQGFDGLGEYHETDPLDAILKK